MSVFAQGDKRGTISGFVYDKTNGEALIGASVYLENLNIGAATNLSGYFVIPNVPLGKQTLIVSFVSFATKKIELNVVKNSSIDKIYLEPDAVQTKEVVIKGDSMRTVDKLFAKPISKIELNAKQINNIPRVIEADLLRSLQTLPGIQSLSDFSSALYIRGGTPDQNLYLIDGTDVYNPEHAFGLFSTFNTNAIKKVELSKGGFSAEYGGRLSSILNVTNLDGNRNRFQGDVSVSLLAASATIQAPLGSIGSLSGSIRRTYLDQTIAKVVDEIPEYYFYDGNLKAFLDLDTKNKVVISFYGGQDKLNYIFDKKAEDPLGFIYNWGNTTGSVNWKRIFNPELFANFWVTASRFSSHFRFDEMIAEDNVITDLTFKGNLEYYISKQFDVKFGFEQKNLTGMLKDEFSDGKVDVDKRRKLYTAFVTTNWRPGELWDIETGLRYDYFHSEKDYQNLDPRLSVKYKLTETSNLKLSGGMFHQYLHRMPRLFFSSIWTTSDDYTKGSSSEHLIFGYQKELFGIYEFEAEAYYKGYRNIYSFNQNYLTDITPDRYDENYKPVYADTKGLYNRGDGKSFGVELLIRKDYGAITGWAAYSLSRTEFTVDGLNMGKAFVPRHDRTSTVNLVANVDINQLLDEIKGNSTLEQGSSKWLLSINYIFATGQPITIPGSVYTVSTMPEHSVYDNNVVLYPAELNTVRLPGYSRLDLSLTYEKNYGSWTLAPYLQVFNAGNRKNVWFINYKSRIVDNQVSQEIKNINMLPILPSIGVNIKF